LNRFLAAFEPAQAGKIAGNAERLVDRQPFIGELRKHADRADALQRSACRFDLARDQAKQCGFAAAVAADKAGALAADGERQSIEQRASVRGGEGDGIQNEKGRHGELPKMDGGRGARAALRCPFLSPGFSVTDLIPSVFVFRRFSPGSARRFCGKLHDHQLDTHCPFMRPARRNAQRFRDPSAIFAAARLGRNLSLRPRRVRRGGRHGAGAEIVQHEETDR
jgi:hypothetical protein